MGREFLEVFEKWATSYDETVNGVDLEYREVFKGYQSILDHVAHLSIGHVLEFGAGTGNLTEKLANKGHMITAIEPSQAMREIAIEKLNGKVNIFDGDFLNFPSPNKPIDTIVSTYAFHHLLDEEKAKAISIYANLLKSRGSIVFADTMYLSYEEYIQAIEDAKSANFLALAEDLQTEYYTTIPYLRRILEENDFFVTFHRCNDFVWIMNAVKR